jgi:mannitol 2-dehydrogenase
MPLSNATLSALPATVAAPGYDRAGLAPGIVHIGCGNFHRAHMAVYLDDLFRLGEGQDWAILGAGVRAGDAAMRDLLLSQDCLSSVIELAPGAHSARVIGAMTGFLPVEPGNAALIAAMSDPAIRIVSLTVTEGGYYIDPKTGTFSPDHPDIRRDAANPGAPDTAFGAIIAALAARRAAGVPAFTVMCCDNVPHNGHVTRDAVVGLARLSDTGLADWIAATVAFPNSMVDRITPATGPRERAMAAAMGLDDLAPVTCEPFRQWVMEDNFPAGRPALEKVGVTFTDRVDAFETMKIRILNGGHQVDRQCRRDPVGGDDRRLHGRSADRRPVPQGAGAGDRAACQAGARHDAAGLCRPDRPALLQRRDRRHDAARRLRRVVAPRRLHPAPSCARASRPARRSRGWRSSRRCGRACARVRARTGRRSRRTTRSGRAAGRGEEARERPRAWIEQRRIYGDLKAAERFAEPFARWLDLIWTKGSRTAIERYLAE